MVTQWEHHKACTRRDLESLIGTLQHTCKVILQGRAFSLLSVTKQHHHHIHLNKEFHSGMMWWKTFAAHWNGVAFIISPKSKMVLITSDASGSWGCGAWYATHWFQLAWDHLTQLWDISAKELVPILITAVIWGHEWKGKQVVAQCDNSAVVAVIKSRYSKDQHLMHMLRCLFFVEAHSSFKDCSSSPGYPQ